MVITDSVDELVVCGNVQGETISTVEDAMQTDQFDPHLTDEFDQYLTGSDPAGDLRDTERELLAAMVQQSVPLRKRRYVRPIAVTAAAALVLGGAGAAAAASDLWESWARKDPYVTVRFQLPSGAGCEYRLGNLAGASPEVEQVVRGALENAEFTDEDVLNGARHVGFPESPLTDDTAYQIGLEWAALLRVEEAMAAHGLSWDEGTMMSGQAIC